ncbi:MAG: hypothetical protein AAF570_11650 [Bacteroidota bacterium]
MQSSTEMGEHAGTVIGKVPGQLTGFYKYEGERQECKKAWVEVKVGTPTDNGFDVVASGRTELKLSKKYQPFSVNIGSVGGGSPDRVIVSFSPEGACHRLGEANCCFLYIDELALDGVGSDLPPEADSVEAEPENEPTMIQPMPSRKGKNKKDKKKKSKRSGDPAKSGDEETQTADEELEEAVEELNKAVEEAVEEMTEEKAEEEVVEEGAPVIISEIGKTAEEVAEKEGTEEGSAAEEVTEEEAVAEGEPVMIKEMEETAEEVEEVKEVKKPSTTVAPDENGEVWNAGVEETEKQRIKRIKKQKKRMEKEKKKKEKAARKAAKKAGK